MSSFRAHMRRGAVKFAEVAGWLDFVDPQIIAAYLATSPGRATIHESNKAFNVRAKRVLDVCVSLIFLLFVAPLLVVTAILVRITFRGSVFVSENRFRLNGQSFRLYGFRTVNDGEHKFNRLARFMRRTSLDEFPQFINVLKGDMSLVGPRPLSSHDLAVLKVLDSETIQGIQRQISMRPGLTSFWMIALRSASRDLHQVTIDIPNLTIQEMQSARIAALVKELEIEAEYMDHWSLTHDLYIFFQSFARKVMLMFGKRGFA